MPNLVLVIVLSVAVGLVLYAYFITNNVKKKFIQSKIIPFDSKINAIKASLNNDGNFKKRACFEYKGVGYGYNLKQNYPKNYYQAFSNMEAPELDKLENLKISKKEVIGV
jgi:hypothetical protein